MKKVLIIGAGNFGLHLARELLSKDCFVDVLDKNSSPQYNLRDYKCGYIVDNVWNIDKNSSIDIASYDCCYICIGDSCPMILRTIEHLKARDAKRIITVINSDKNINTIKEAGSDMVVCPAQLTGKALASELLGEKALLF